MPFIGAIHTWIYACPSGWRKKATHPFNQFLRTRTISFRARERFPRNPYAVCECSYVVLNKVPHMQSALQHDLCPRVEHVGLGQRDGGTRQRYLCQSFVICTFSALTIMMSALWAPHTKSKWMLLQFACGSPRRFVENVPFESSLQAVALFEVEYPTWVLLASVGKLSACHSTTLACERKLPLSNMER